MTDKKRMDFGTLVTPTRLKKLADSNTDQIWRDTILEFTGDINDQLVVLYALERPLIISYDGYDARRLAAVITTVLRVCKNYGWEVKDISGNKKDYYKFSFKEREID